MSSTEIFEFEEEAASQLPAVAGGVFDDDVPPAGTQCAGCRAMGHWCAAKRYCGESKALCLPCANGVDCDVVTALRRAKQISESGEIVLDRFDRPPAPCRSIRVAPGVVVQTKHALTAAHLPYTPDPAVLRESKREIQRERVARPLPQLPPVRVMGKPKELPEGVKAMPRLNADQRRAQGADPQCACERVELGVSEASEYPDLENVPIPQHENEAGRAGSGFEAQIARAADAGETHPFEAGAFRTVDGDRHCRRCGARACYGASSCSSAGN